MNMNMHMKHGCFLSPEKAKEFGIIYEVIIIDQRPIN